MDKMTVQQAIDIISMQLPVSWDKVANKPELVTSDVLNHRLSSLINLTSPDGAVWVSSIDNNGRITVTKEV